MKLQGLLRVTGLLQLWTQLVHSLRAARLLMTAGPPDPARLRKEYSARGLDETGMPADPVALFGEWFGEAVDAQALEPNAFCLSTCVDNRPSARIVLMKAFDADGVVWFTNYESRKSMELAANPYAAATFWWGALERSVRVEGPVERLSDAESDAYHQIRPRSAQIGAWSSQQSRPIASRDALEAQEAASIARFAQTTDIARPPHWGGWRMRPSRVEFWKGREHRLHDRVVYSAAAGGWTRERLQP